jgi:succinyl-diaminopimelate desuccinylase
VHDPLPLAQALIRCVSVTPADGGAQAMLAFQLRNLGFEVTPLPFGATLNFFARIGAGSPHICFAGHTDVVPPGEGWRHHPFGGVVEDDILYGRGACDMKGAVAAFTAAASRHLAEHPSPNHSVSLLITGDEEGPATDGTVRVLQWMAENRHLPDLCIVGEPTNPRFLGEMVKTGRRGSLNACITVRGKQGHVAYPMRASNPLHRLIPALAQLTSARLDEGTAWFEPSSLQLTTVDVGNTAANVIPATARARLNIRFNDLHTGESLSSWLRDCVSRHAPDADISIQVSGEAFLTQPGPLVERVCSVIERETGHAPKRDTAGGTSDARFIARHAPVIEFGLVGASMHQVDECVPVADLRALAGIYAAILKELCG